MSVRRNEGYVPIHTGIDTVAEADRSVTTNAANSKFGKNVVRVKVRSRQLMEAFNPVRLFLHSFCRFPYTLNLRVDGTVYLNYKMSCKSFSFILFGLTSIFSVVLFLFVTVGLFAASIQKSQGEIDICGADWETRGMTQTFVPIIVFYLWLTLVVIGAIYGLRYGKQYEFYYNYWNRAVQVMDMDVTFQLRSRMIWTNVLFFFVILLYVGIFATQMVDMMQITTAMFANAFTRFFVPNIYKGSKPAMTYREFVLRKPENKGNSSFIPRSVPYVYDEEITYTIAKTGGFIMMVYGMYGVRAFVIQFLFFSKALRNAAFIWNERFRNHILKEKPNVEDQTLVRMDMNFLIQDHLILVQLFKMTESIFCVMLQWFYFFEIINVTLTLYGFSLISSVSSCHLYYDLIEMHDCNETISRKEGWMNNSKYVAFEDPYKQFAEYQVGDTIMAVLIFLQNVLLIYDATIQAAAAHEEAMRGWQILRRHSFMTANSVQERNFVHSLIISFARNNPIQLSAGGYFAVHKRILIPIFLTILIYFITLLQFKPGHIDQYAKCNNMIVSDADTR